MQRASNGQFVMSARSTRENRRVRIIALMVAIGACLLARLALARWLWRAEREQGPMGGRGTGERWIGQRGAPPDGQVAQ